MSSDLAYLDNDMVRDSNEFNVTAHAMSAQSVVKNYNTANDAMYCVDCGRVIPEARKKAIPGSVRCVACQEAYDEWDK